VIATIRGHLQHIGEGELILELNGLGVRIAVTKSVMDTYPEIGKAIFLHTKLIVKEDALDLYGFTSNEERELFETLLGVSGIGPKLALSILSHLSPEVLRSAVANNQPEVITRVPGLGKKTAEKVVFNLKDVFAAPVGVAYMPSVADTEVLSVLNSLGYSIVEAQAAIQAIPPDTPEDVEGRVRQALKYFARP
jgi:Holliday junction DNA helicase RuvA